MLKNHVMNTILGIYLSLLLLIGIPGNIWSAMIMGSDKSNRQTTRILIILLSVSDTMVLLTAVLRYWLVQMVNWDFRQWGPYSCKLHIFLVAFLTDFAVGALCAIAVERLIVVIFPHKSKTLITVQSMTLGMFCLGLCLSAKNSLHFWLMGNANEMQSIDASQQQQQQSNNLFSNVTQADNKAFKCTHNSDYESIFGLFIKIDFISFAILPYLILFSANIIIYLKLRKQRVLVKKHKVKSLCEVTQSVQSKYSLSPIIPLNGLQTDSVTTTIAPPNPRSALSSLPDTTCVRRRPENVIKLLLALTVIHVVCTLPGTLFTLLSFFSDHVKKESNSTYIKQIKRSLVIFIFTNNSINFFGFYVSSSGFRRTVWSTIRKCCVICHSCTKTNSSKMNNDTLN